MLWRKSKPQTRREGRAKPSIPKDFHRTKTPGAKNIRHVKRLPASVRVPNQPRTTSNDKAHNDHHMNADGEDRVNTCDKGLEEIQCEEEAM